MTLNWRAAATAPLSATSGCLMLWREDWIDADFNPTGILVGYFQEGSPGEERFVVADFDPSQDCYYGREIADPRQWPTHYADYPAGPVVTETDGGC